ncbi:helix-turn-helix transcriptional regulator [Streptomyces sp. AK02-01A]|uniref:helix-turn-helix transcriptional regulator n=1 Tax=Streptomyces sp. AK02-01A TaxID=3028648 RepID=UPI0029A4D096|nr:helix-turn-helix transcriptional regulator [Streptomyces sp. AK02-01A]MDX3853928.1 helix-turn-helix transcriptional regulator [Streptomyces sp. AK02-01A]
MTDRHPLGEFLSSRRAALDPQRAGLPASSLARRVAGLRREEVAALAGISAAYYTKLEQGRVGQVSDQVLRAVEDALQLDGLEREHFRTLVRAAAGRPSPGPRGGPATGPASRPVSKPRAGLVAMVHALDTPALLHGPRLDVLAVNDAARLLIDDFDALPLRERNLARWTFLNPRAKVVYPQWTQIAPQTAAALRHLTVSRQGDTLLEQLVGEIMIASPEFARYWSDYQLYEHSYGSKKFFNETVGELDLHYETLSLTGDDGQSVILYTADRNSPSEDKLRLLASWNAPSDTAGEPGRLPRPGAS